MVEMDNKETNQVELTTAAAIGIGSAILGAGGAWGATRKTVKTLEEDVSRLEGEHLTIIDRLARIETKLDMALGERN